MQSDAMNQVLVAGSNSCCASASAFVVGKLNPHNAVARISIRIAGSDLWFTDMIVTLAAMPDLGRVKCRNGDPKAHRGSGPWSAGLRPGAIAQTRTTNAGPEAGVPSSVRSHWGEASRC